jgi:altronate dehydratase
VNPVIVISDRDNVATALEALVPGQSVPGSTPFTVREAIPRGHKVAMRTIPAGGSVIKYGNQIGLATAEIPEGAHVHTHNVASARGRGDLHPGDHPAHDGRIAEPEDERGNA